MQEWKSQLDVMERGGREEQERRVSKYKFAHTPKFLQDFGKSKQAHPQMKSYCY